MKKLLNHDHTRFCREFQPLSFDKNRMSGSIEEYARNIQNTSSNLFWDAYYLQDKAKLFFSRDMLLEKDYNSIFTSRDKISFANQFKYINAQESQDNQSVILICFSFLDNNHAF